jgi:hypothetical protein
LASICVIFFVMVIKNELKFGNHANWFYLFPSICLDFPKKLSIWLVEKHVIQFGTKTFVSTLKYFGTKGIDVMDVVNKGIYNS